MAQFRFATDSCVCAQTCISAKEAACRFEFSLGVRGTMDEIMAALPVGADASGNVEAEAFAPAGEPPEGEVAPACVRRWTTPKTGKAIVVSGGFMAKPVVVETKSHCGSNYIQVRQYDNWLYSMVVAKSRSNRCDKLARSKTFGALVEQCGEFALADDAANDAADPMKAVIDEAPHSDAKRRRIQRRAKDVTMLAPMGVNKTVTLLIPPRLCRKTLWVREEDIAELIGVLSQEFAPLQPSAKPCGIFWLDGKSMWVGRWKDDRGCVHEVERKVSRTCKMAGVTVLCGQEEWNAKWLQGKRALEEQLRKLGGLHDAAAGKVSSK